MEGVPEAMEMANKLGIRLIPGVEISSIVGTWYYLYARMHNCLLYLHTCTHANTHTNMNTKAYMTICLHTHAYIHAYTHICLHAYIHTYNTYMYSHQLWNIWWMYIGYMSACMHGYIHIHTSEHLYTCIHWYIHTYIHTHTHICCEKSSWEALFLG